MGPPHQAVAVPETPNRKAATAAIAIFFIGHLLRWKYSSFEIWRRHSSCAFLMITIL
jgi:hypothetical protein